MRVARAIAINRWSEEISQRELAERLGTQTSSISRIEKGEQNITLDYVDAIAKALDKDVKFFFEDHKIKYGDTAEYELKIFDNPLVRFRMTRDGGVLKAKILDTDEEMRDLFPLDLEVSDEGILKWLRKRVIPKNRELVGKILSALGLKMDDLKGIIDVCMGLSLNDSYWVTQTTFEGEFSKYNLYKNRFDRIISLIAYVGYGDLSRGHGTTPELTTGGMLRKAWHFSSTNGIHLYKAGTSDFANAGNEPFSEFYASQVAEKMGLHHVHYDLANWHRSIASKCKLFTDINTSYIPIGRIVPIGGIDACIDYYKKLGDEFYQELASMLVFDAVIVNEDRHFGNFGVLRDNLSGKIISPAPIFDNGLSLLCYGMKSDFEDNLDEYINGRTNPYGSENQFFVLAKRVMGPKQKEELRHLINFRFQESDVANLPSWRTGALENMVRNRAKMLLE
ncbi:MAG: helix-turn-helix domain-containing protein [Firmicutes bacterium]|nr:helix-turn-helix domain-containing protein [Bacillota bacterium]